MRLFLPLAIWAIAAGPATSADYAILLSRPTSIGERFHVKAKGNSTLQARMRVANTPLPLNEETVNLTLEYDTEVLATYPSKRPSRERIVLGPASCTKDGAAFPLPPPGTVLEVSYSAGKTRLSMNGQEVSADLYKVLTVVISIGSGEVGDDEIFGASERKRLGDAWPVNVEKMAQELGKKDGMEVDPKDITGSAKLASLAKDQGRDCLQVAVDIRIKRIKGLQGALNEPGLKIMKSEFRINLDGLFPLDPSRERQRESETMYMEVVMSGKAGPPGQEQPVEAFITMSQHTEQNITALETVKGAKP